jgi:hypothetical protein
VVLETPSWLMEMCSTEKGEENAYFETREREQATSFSQNLFMINFHEVLNQKKKLVRFKI